MNEWMSIIYLSARLFKISMVYGIRWGGTVELNDQIQINRRGGLWGVALLAGKKIQRCNAPPVADRSIK